VPFQKLSDDRRGEPSAAIRERVEGARARQTARFAGVAALGWRRAAIRGRGDRSHHQCRHGPH